MNKLHKFYTKENETFDDALKRVSIAFSGGDDALAKRLYEYSRRGWFMYASPLFNAPADGNWKKAMPISCFGNFVEDTIQGLCDHSTETRWMSVAGGGVGGYWGNVRSVDDKAPGPIPFIHTIDADVIAYKQGSTRRAAYAAYMDYNHPDIMEFLNIRMPTGGDESRKAFNIHHAVNIDHAFINAVLGDEDIDLVDPNDKTIRGVLPARNLWERILETRYRTGEPYIVHIGEANKHLHPSLKEEGLRIHHSNLCVAPETLILTDQGHLPIADLEGDLVNVWNGEEWSRVTIHKTGENQSLLKVITDSGQELECTPYHKFYVLDGYGKDYKEVRAKDLSPGDKLARCSFPFVTGDKELKKAYINGFYSGDGCLTKQGQRIYLYNDKRNLSGEFTGGGWVIQEEFNRMYKHYSDLKDKFFVPLQGYSVDSRLEWLAGWLDADGCVYRNGDNEMVVGASVNKPFLKEVQLMLQTLGVGCKIKSMREEGMYKLPSNDGSGGVSEFYCKEVYRLIIDSNGTQSLLQLGINFRRLKVSARVPNRDASHFIKVSKVVDTGRIDDTYCFTEPKRGMGVFNGILTGQCSEIMLPSDRTRSFVCCLSSVNVEHYKDWSGTQLIADLVTMLNNALDIFICKAPQELHKAVFSAMQERSIGLGAMGFHSYLQKNGIALGSVTAQNINEDIFRTIWVQAQAQSYRLSKKYSHFPDGRSGDNYNAHLIAIAPNANSALLLDTSPGIEPIMSNYYTQYTRAGAITHKNKYLRIALRGYGLDTPEIWERIASNRGSVQDIEEIPLHIRNVFKTAFEEDQNVIVRLARDRQKYIDQAQSVNLFFNDKASRSYVNQVHLNAFREDLTGQPLKSLYYLRTKSGEDTEYVSNKIECVGCD